MRIILLFIIGLGLSSGILHIPDSRADSGVALSVNRSTNTFLNNQYQDTYRNFSYSIYAGSLFYAVNIRDSKSEVADNSSIQGVFGGELSSQLYSYLYLARSNYQYTLAPTSVSELSSATDYVMTANNAIATGVGVEKGIVFNNPFRVVLAATIGVNRYNGVSMQSSVLSQYPSYQQESLSYNAPTASAGARLQYRLSRNFYLSLNYLMQLSRHRFSVDGQSYANASSLGQAQKISYSFLEKQNVISTALQIVW